MAPELNLCNAKHRQGPLRARSVANRNVTMIRTAMAYERAKIEWESEAQTKARAVVDEFQQHLPTQRLGYLSEQLQRE
jgi:hypothetical protein